MTTPTNPKYRLFPNGSSHMIWMSRNCDQCWKAWNGKTQGRNRKCAIESDIALNGCAFGSLLPGNPTPADEKRAAKIAKRLGWDGVSYLENDCPERQEKRPKTMPKQKPITGGLFS